MTSNPAKKIVFVAYPNLKLLDLAGPMQVFADANLQGKTYDICVVSVTGGSIPTDAVIPVETTRMSDLVDLDIDTLMIVGGPGTYQAVKDQELLAQVRRLAVNTRRIGSVCTGAFVLAFAGLLRGRSAVTHWESCDELQKTAADITVKADAIYVKDGHIWTSAGVTSGIDMSLAMVAEDLGRKPALALARSLVCYMVRPGGQSQFSAPLQQQFQSASGRFDELNAWMERNLAADLNVEALAAKAMMSPRNFARLYKQHTGISPAKAVEAIRVEAACRLLEETDLPLGLVAQRCGFVDDERLRRAITRAFNIAPGEYRQRFGRRDALV